MPQWLLERWGILLVETLMVWMWICYLCFSVCTTNFVLLFHLLLLLCFPVVQNGTGSLPLAVFSAWVLSPCTPWFSCPGQSSACVSPWRELGACRQWLRELGWLSLNGAVLLTHPPEEPLSLSLIQKETYRWNVAVVFPLVSVSNFHNCINTPVLQG